ncbi:MAG: hypothetical protein ACO3UU_15750, partial [Minisyncoccia bacterium]
GFNTFHKFRGVESVVYKTEGESGLSGLTTDSFYYVKVIDAQTVKLFNTENDAVLGVNTISLGSYGTGVHKLESLEKKKIVTSVIVTDSGQNYQNKERTCSQTGINTALGQINIPNHGYNTREILVYSTTGNQISGLSTTLRYIVTKVDDDNFKLSEVGIGSTSTYFYQDTKQYINITSTGSGTHIFNYEPINVTISGVIGVSTLSGQNFNAVLQPIFRGEIDSVDIKTGGIGYGSSEILNYNRGNGSNAILTPILTNGRLTSVKVVNGGSGYDASTSILITPAGTGCNISFKIKQWNVNLVQKNLNIISGDDGFIKKGLNDRYELQYSHAYTPRKLRESVYQKSQDNETKYGVFDLQTVGGQESPSQFH